jgi:K+-transporting ATPase ATPase C chain
MTRDMILAIRACAVTFVLCSVVYPAVVWGGAQLVFPARAEGSLIDGPPGAPVIGSELIAQGFESARYFHPRPSAVDYKADAAAGSNLGTNNPDLRQAAAERAAALAAGPERPVPVDLVTASGSGLDPDISPDAAIYQADRVAAARGLRVEVVRALIEAHINRSGVIVGAPPRVSVLLLNLALDKMPVAGR